MPSKILPKSDTASFSATMAEVASALPRCMPFFRVPARPEKNALSPTALAVRRLPLPEILPFELPEFVGGENELDPPQHIPDVPEMAVQRPEQGARRGADDEVGPDPLLFSSASIIPRWQNPLAAPPERT